MMGVDFNRFRNPNRRGQKMRIEQVKVGSYFQHARQVYIILCHGHSASMAKYVGTATIDQNVEYCFWKTELVEFEHGTICKAISLRIA
jgi:hypothetical protein